MATTVDTPSQPAPSTAESIAAFLSEYKLLLLVLLAPLPMLAIHFRNMWDRPQHQYFPIVLIAVGVLFWSRLQPLSVEEPSRVKRVTAHVMMGMAFLLLFIGTVVIFSPWLATVAFVIAAGAAMLVISERYHVENLFGIWVLLWLLVPLPGVYEQQLSHFLQRATTVVSGHALEKIDVPNVVEGTTLVIPGQHLFIEEACTGIVSMMSVIACCLILAVWANRGWLHAILLVLTGLVLVSVTNIMRIVALAVADVWFDIDLATGWKHDLLGVCLFSVAILLALSADRMFQFFLAPIPSSFDEGPEAKSWWTKAYNAITNLGIPWQDTIAQPGNIGGTTIVSGTLILWVAAFALVCAASIYAIATRETTTADLSEPAFAKSLGAQSMPQQIDGWVQTGFGDRHADRLFAQSSKVWTYTKDDVSAVFSLDFSFDSWHRLYNCYSSVGWDQIGPPFLTEPYYTGSVYLRTRFRKGDQRHGLLMYCMVDPQGTPFDPPDAVTVMENTKRRLQKGNHTLYQIQLWATAPRPIEGAQRRAMHRLFETLRGELMAQLNRQDGAAK